MGKSHESAAKGGDRARYINMLSVNRLWFYDLPGRVVGVKFFIVLMLWIVALLVAILFGLGYEGLGMLAICWGSASIPMATIQLAKRVPNISALRLYFLLVYSVSIPFIVVPPFYIYTTHDNLSSNALTVMALLLIHVASLTFVLPSRRTHEETHP